MSVGKTNIEFTQNSEIKSDSDSKRHFNTNNLEPIANNNTSVNQSIIFETKNKKMNESNRIEANKYSK